MFEVEARLAQGMSVSGVARELGMDRKTVRKLAAAARVPRPCVRSWQAALALLQEQDRRVVRGTF
jgi:transposase